MKLSFVPNLALVMLALVCACKAEDVPLGACEDGWEQYKDEKCYALIAVDRLVSYEEAVESCGKLENYAASLPIIRSQAEQAFLTNFLFRKQAKVDNFWIGLRNGTTQSFAWVDGSNLTASSFANWEEGSPRNRLDYCVQLSADEVIGNSTVGKWRDVPCSRKNAVICQRMQTWTLGALQRSFLEARKVFNKTISQLSFTMKEAESKIANLTMLTDQLKRNPVPIGFIYVQLSSQPEPSTIWPSPISWTEVSSSYSGLFFRVLGSGSNSFGSTQSENVPSLTNVQFSWNNNGAATSSISLTGSGWSSWIKSGGATGEASALTFYKSSGEVRPRNTAIKIWKRTA